MTYQSTIRITGNVDMKRAGNAGHRVENAASGVIERCRSASRLALAMLRVPVISAIQVPVCNHVADRIEE